VFWITCRSYRRTRGLYSEPLSADQAAHEPSGHRQTPPESRPVAHYSACWLNWSGTGHSPQTVGRTKMCNYFPRSDVDSVLE